MKKLSILLIAILCALPGCKTSTVAAVIPVYVIGYDSPINNVIWRAGVEYTLAGGLTVTCAFLYNYSDVYLGGSGSSPLYSKNGVVRTLPVTGGGDGSVNSIYVTSTDVYVAGYQVINNVRVPTYWKNGSIITLPFVDGGEIKSIFISGTDVVACGYDGGSAVTWKNGIEATLATGGSPTAYGSDIIASGTDIYVAGWDGSKHVYWKNGSATTLTLSSGTTDLSQQGIVLAGNDIYMSGTQTILGVSNATYWKNGDPVIVAVDAVANAMTISGKDIYVTGNYYVAGIAAAAYWKNGTVTALPYTTLLNGSGIYIAVKS